MGVGVCVCINAHKSKPKHSPLYTQTYIFRVVDGCKKHGVGVGVAVGIKDSDQCDRKDHANGHG